MAMSMRLPLLLCLDYEMPVYCVSQRAVQVYGCVGKRGKDQRLTVR